MYDVILPYSVLVGALHLNATATLEVLHAKGLYRLLRGTGHVTPILYSNCPVHTSKFQPDSKLW